MAPLFRSWSSAFGGKGKNAPPDQLGFGETFIDLDRFLPWAGIALIGTYVTNAVINVLPLRILDPEWINRACGILRGAASFPIEGMVLILLGAYIVRPSKEPKSIARLRRLCIWVALGFLLMIPLQTWAGLKLIDQAIETQKQLLQPAKQALSNIYAATSEGALIEAIRTIPGASPALQGRFLEPYQKVREQLIRQIEPEIRTGEAKLSQSIDAIRNNGRLGLIRDGAIAFFNAIAFAAIGRSGALRPTLLRAILRPGSTLHRVPDDVERWVDEQRSV